MYVRPAALALHLDGVLACGLFAGHMLPQDSAFLAQERHARILSARPGGTVAVSVAVVVDAVAIAGDRTRRAAVTVDENRPRAALADLCTGDPDQTRTQYASAQRGI